MRSKEDILKPFVETPFRHAEVVDKDNALKAMEMFAKEVTKDLTHYRDTTKGMWATDRPDLIPEEIRHMFVQL
jgi:hypothetical protein